ncbi:MAG: hypothetical protein MJ090_05650 [Clostridia bacterium]|nr:hypothetical protein [Clostridia bacterium]
MADNKFSGSTSFKEAVCIDAGRVYDSCCDRDCLEDLRCFFTAETQSIIDTAVSVKLTKSKVLNVLIDVEPISFNKGFYSCDLTFYFLNDLEVYTAPNSCPTPVSGVSFFSKKVILYGSDGNVQVFSSNHGRNIPGCDKTAIANSNSPKCILQCVDPVALTARLGTVTDNYQNIFYIPQAVTDYIGAPLVTTTAIGTSTVYVTLGLFTIVQLIRDVQMLIPVYDFCVPEKQCDDTTDQPCDVFRKIKFPTDDFFPPKAENCGCNNE